MTPNLAVIEIHTAGRRDFRLWVPLFLLWIPVLLLSPLILLALLVLMAVFLAGRVNPFRAISVFWGILCSLPGIHVHVSTQHARILVRVL